jgi:teichuronic acid biosynthesis glycosyltransferase TuaC
VRVVVVTTSYPAHEGDPAGHFVRAEARALAAHGDDVTVLAPLACAPPPEVRLRVIAINGGGAFGWPGVAARLVEAPSRILEAIAWTVRARRVLAVRDSHEPVDRVVAHWALPSAFPIAAAVRAPVDVVSHGSDVRLLVWLPRALRSDLVNRILDRAREWRFVSERLRDALLVSLTARQRRRVIDISRVEPSLFEMPDIARVRALGANLRATLASETAWVVVGRLVAGKRVERAIAYAHARSSGAHGSPSGRPVLVVVGDGPERERLVAMAHAVRDSVEVRFVGNTDRETALAWMVATGTLLFASEREGLSTVLREAEVLGVTVENVV